MMKTYVVKDGTLVETHNDDWQVGFFSKPDVVECKFLTERMRIDEHNLTSALDPNEQPRFELEPDHAVIILNWPRRYQSKEDFEMTVSTLGMFLFRDRLVVVTPEPDDPFSGKPPAKLHSIAHVVLKVIHRSILHFQSHLNGVHAISGELEDKISSAMENKYLLQMFALEKSLVYYVNAIFANGVLIEKIKHNGQKINLSPDDMELVDDLLIDNNQCYKQAEIYSNVVSSLMDARASIVGNNLNVLIKILNFITIAIMVPTLVVSIFSMNVTLPLDKDDRFSFFLIMLLAAIPTAALLWYWKHKRLW